MSGDHDHDPYLGVWWRFGPFRLAAAAGTLLLAVYLLDRFGVLSPAVGAVAHAALAVLAAWNWGREALESLARRGIDIDVLMLTATVGSAVLGLWEEAAVLAVLYGAAESLEEYTYDRTRGAIRSLLELAPASATLVRGGREHEVVATQLAPGDRFVVRPGERVATDGVIVEGVTSLDEAAVTGESTPVERGKGDRVVAGTINLTGSVEVEVTVRYEENTLSRIIHLVEEAQEQKTKAQQLIDRFGDRYSPMVLVASALVLVVPPLFGGDFGEWARRAVTLTVAAAPCALVMSTPVAVAAAIGSAGRSGLLIKGGVHLENLGRVRVVAFDKTGTLTKGQPSVTDVIPIGETRSDEVLRLAAAVEARSEHPLGRAIVAQARMNGIDVPPVVEFRAATGAGATGSVEGAQVTVGKPAMFSVDGASLGSTISALQSEGRTVVVVGRGRAVTGLIALRDEPRAHAAAAIGRLRRMGIHRLVMLTGDNQATATAIGDAVGIDETFGELSPEDKITAVRRLEGEHGAVAMIGDGINDAPALAAATVGVAMGVAGTDAAVEAADVALMGEDLDAIPTMIWLGRRVRAISVQNIAFSIALLSVLIPAAVAGAVTVAVAVTVHEVAEIIAVLNGLRARKQAPATHPDRAQVPVGA
ncbi:MAG: heavy metal translocating P-type ATPase [Acidimicrobiia bacterium]